MKTTKIIFLIVILAYVSNVSAQTVYTTKTGEKYHTNNCRYLKYSKKEITLKKVKELGYQACKVCKPTANNTKNSATSSTSNTVSKKSTRITTTKTAAAIQCLGKTKSGARCKRKTTNSNGRCYQH